MKIFGFTVPKTFFRIFLSVAISMLATGIVFANILYLNYEKIGLKTAYDFNIKYLRQVSHNITYMNDFIGRYCLAQFYEPDMQKFIYSRETGDEFYFDFMRGVGKLQSSTLIYPMIHTIVVYNGYQNKVYSTSSKDGKEDPELADIFRQQKSVPMLKPIPRIISTDIYSRDQNLLQENIKVFTYFMTEVTGGQIGAHSTFAVNINTEWMFNHVKGEAADDSKLMLIDGTGVVVADQSNPSGAFEQLEEKYVQKIMENGENGGSFLEDTISGRKVVTCLRIDGMEWTLVNEQPYDAVFSHVKQIRDYTLLSVIGLFILILVVSAFVSKSIYNPIHNVVKQIRGALSAGVVSQGRESDTEYIQNAFNINMQQIRELEKYKKNTRDVLKENLIKTLLFDTMSPMQQLSEENMDDISSLLSGEGSMVVILLKIDRYGIFAEKDSETRKLDRFVIINSMTEKFSEKYPMEIVPTGNGEFILVLNLGQKTDDRTIGKVREGIVEVQGYVRQMTELTFSAFISEIAENKERLYHCYIDLNKVIRYKIMYPPGCVLSHQLIKKNVLPGKKDYPEDVEEKVLATIRSENLPAVVEEFGRFMEQIKPMDIDNYMMSLSRLAISIDRTVNQININRIGEISISFNEFYGKLLRMENVEDIKEDFINLFKTISKQQKAVTTNRSSHLINAIVEYIHQEYGNKNLTLKDIAAKTKMSYGYLSVVFKESMNKSLAEYLNEYRLGKAAELLQMTDYSVLEIIDRVGYDSESNFYKIFKKFYGTTPREYRMNIGLGQKEQNRP